MTGLVWRRERSASRISSWRVPSDAAVPRSSSRAERGLDERREVLDVGAHDDDVAGLEARVLLQQVQDGVAQHLDLPAAAVAGVDADAVVAGCQQRAGVAVASPHSGRCAVGSDIVLDPLQQRRLAPLAACRSLVAVCLRATEDELHLAGVAAPRRKQRVARFRCGRVLPAGQMPGLGTDLCLEALPERR